MAAFLSTQLDFILFFYGMSFILLGATCVAIARMGREESWAVLGLFGFLHGTSEWLDLSALVISDTPAFALARTAVMTASFVVLMEFARREAIRLGVKAPGLWLHIPLLAAVALAGAINGDAAANDFARYIFGFLGGCATSWVFFRLAQKFSGFTKRLAMCAAAGFAAYAVAAGLIVPPGPIWPATVLNQYWFAHLTGVPIQLIRGTLACWLAFSIWSIWGQQRVSEVSSVHYARFLRQQYKWTLVAMAITLVAGWALTEFLGGVYRQNVQREARGEIDLLAGRILAETDTVDRMAKALASSRSMRALASGVISADDEHVQATLDAQVEGSGAKRGYILSTSGKVIVSSDPEAPGFAGGADHSSSPYFRQSMAGLAGYDFGSDPWSGGRAYYASFPIRGANGVITGVAVLEKPLGNLAADLRLFDRPYFLVDATGTVVLTNRPQLKLQALWPVPGQTPSTPPEAANNRTIFPQEITEPSWTTFSGERVYAVRYDADRGQWSLLILNPIREIYASRVLGIVVTLLVAIMILIYQFARERSVHDNVQIEQRMQLQDLARDLRFQATTDPLTGLFNRLKFDQALDGEIQRSARYDTPLALVLYDVDHFKSINDSHGHQIGDKVLIELSRFVAANIRGVDVLARWGGEEFALMLPGCDVAMAAQAAEKLRAAIALAGVDPDGKVTCSFGVAQFCSGDTAEMLIARADAALYCAKINGRNRVELAGWPVEARPELTSVA